MARDCKEPPKRRDMMRRDSRMGDPRGPRKPFICYNCQGEGHMVKYYII